MAGVQPMAYNSGKLGIENNRSGFYYCFGDDPGSCSAGEDRAAYIRHVVMLALIGEY